MRRDTVALGPKQTQMVRLAMDDNLLDDEIAEKVNSTTAAVGVAISKSRSLGYTIPYQYQRRIARSMDPGQKPSPNGNGPTSQGKLEPGAIHLNVGVEVQRVYVREAAKRGTTVPKLAATLLTMIARDDMWKAMFDE